MIFNFFNRFKNKDIAETPNKNIPINKIIIGLGNHGSEYLRTRHNIGYMVATALIEKYNGKIETILRVADYSIIEIFGQKILVILPLTYMNRSGVAAKYFLEKYLLLPKDLLIIVDEYNFPLGKIHLKASGSDGGHNGIFSIIEALDTVEFFRLRCGIDKNFGQNELVDYVLSDFNENEIATVNKMLQTSICAIEYFIKTDNDVKAMSMINSGKFLEDFI